MGIGGKKLEKKPFFFMSPCRGHKVMTWGEEDAAGFACHARTHTPTHTVTMINHQELGYRYRDQTGHDAPRVVQGHCLVLVVEHVEADGVHWAP